jgi:hypothetical protein
MGYKQHQMAARRKHRIYQKRPGLAPAAAELGCTYSHLRRVILGERPSPLLTLYRAWKAGQKKPAVNLKT